MIFGAKGKDAYQDKSLQWVLIAVGILIVVAAGGKMFGQNLLEASQGEITDGATGVATGDVQQNIYATLYHPKVLGLLVIFSIVGIVPFNIDTLGWILGAFFFGALFLNSRFSIKAT